jgi:hypothetical protein
MTRNLHGRSFSRKPFLSRTSESGINLQQRLLPTSFLPPLFGGHVSVTIHLKPAVGLPVPTANSSILWNPTLLLPYGTIERLLVPILWRPILLLPIRTNQRLSVSILRNPTLMLPTRTNQRLRQHDQHEERPLLSIKTTGSISLERVAKPLKNRVATKILLRVGLNLRLKNDKGCSWKRGSG